MKQDTLRSAKTIVILLLIVVVIYAIFKFVIQPWKENQFKENTAPTETTQIMEETNDLNLLSSEVYLNT